MKEKIWIISLILIALFNKVRLVESSFKTEYLETDNAINVTNATDFVVCVHVNENLKKGDTFYLLVSSDEKGAKIDKKIYYYFSSKSCKDKTVNVDAKNPGDPFNNHAEPNLESSSDTIYYEYKIEKLNGDENYMITLITGGDGKQIKVGYAKISPATLIIIIACSIAGGVVLIIVVLIIICCCLCRRKKVAAVQQQYQSSFVNDQVIPRDSNVD